MFMTDSEQFMKAKYLTHDNCVITVSEKLI